MTISIEEVRKIARLAHIKLTEEEEKRHADTISAVLDYMKVLNEVDTAGVEPTAQVTGLMNVLREDAVSESGLQTDLMSAWPDKTKDELKVPAVFGDEE